MELSDLQRDCAYEKLMMAEGDATGGDADANDYLRRE